jgi:hypothetical protein
MFKKYHEILYYDQRQYQSNNPVIPEKVGSILLPLKWSEIAHTKNVLDTESNQIFCITNSGNQRGLKVIIKILALYNFGNKVGLYKLIKRRLKKYKKNHFVSNWIIFFFV